MPGAGGEEVGRISIRVVPNLDRFREELDAKLAEYEKRSYTIKFNADFDDKGLREKIKASAEGVTAKVKAEADVKGFREKIKAETEGMKVNLRVDVDGYRLKALGEKMKKGIRQNRVDLQPSVLKEKSSILNARVDLNTKMAEFELQMWKAHAKAEAIIPAKIKPDVEMAGFELAKWRIEALFSNIKVTIKERKVQGFTASELLPEAWQAGSAAGSGLAKVGEGAASSVPGLLSFGGVLGLIVVAVVALITPVLALAAGLLTVAPGLLAIAAPVGAVMLGLNGIKKAATDAGLFADSNGSKKGGGGLGKAMKDIQDAVSGEFAAKLTEPFRQLGDLMPQLQAPMVTVATGLSDIASGFINALTSAKGVGDLQNIITKVGQGLSAAAPGVESFTQGILHLVSAISDHFPNLGKTFSDLGTRFSNAVDSITKDDPVTHVSRLDTMMRQLGDSVGEVAGFIKDLFTNGFDNMSNVDFGASIKTFLSDVRTFVRDSLPGLGKGFMELTKDLTSVGPALNSLGSILGVVTQIADKMQMIDRLNPFSIPGMTSIKDEAGALFSGDKLTFNTGDGGFIDTIKGYLNGPVKKAVTDSGKDAGQAYKVGMLGGGGKFDGGADITGAINDQLQTVTSASLGAQREALNSVFKGTGVTDAVKAQIGTQLQGVTQEVQTQMSSLGPALNEAVNGAIEPLQSLPSKVSSAFAGMANGVTAAFGLVILAISGKASAVGSAVGSAFDQIPTISTKAFAAIPQNAGKSMADTNTAISTGAKQAVQTVAGIPGQMAGSLAASNGALTNAGIALMAGLKGGLERGMNDVLAYARTIAGQIAAVKGPLPKDRQELVPAGVALMDGLNSGMQDGMGNVLDNAKQMAKAIFEAFKETFGSAPALSFNFGAGGAPSVSPSSGVPLSPSVGSAGKAAKIDAATQARLDGLKQESDAIDVQLAQLKAQSDASDKAGKAQIKQQTDALKLRKDNIKASSDQIAYEAKYSDQAKQNDLTKDMPKKIADGATNVAQGVISSYASDVGIGGNGAIEALANYGMQFGSQFVFHVNNMDEAVSGMQAQQNNQALSYTP